MIPRFLRPFRRQASDQFVALYAAALSGIVAGRIARADDFVQWDEAATDALDLADAAIVALEHRQESRR